ncbi:MAG: hypothetical protein QXN23_00790 [Candidatus Caldarchaeum sp.]|uniref:Uncharacterized protein n=1 Tax=Caldiarchaeum subterraneum TaxID=311458 RepID=A0A7C4HYL8_CALS0|nr:hypothetical protein [Candidatus Caldarchaeales archaeon]
MRRLVSGSDAGDFEAELMDKVERLYSLVNRIRFFRDLKMDNEVSSLSLEMEKLRTSLLLSEDEVEKLADELDEYYISGASTHGDTDPLTYWTLYIKDKLSKK